MGRVRLRASPQVLPADRCRAATRSGDDPHLGPILLQYDQPACTPKSRHKQGETMTFPVESQKTIDAYLAGLRKQLRELMDEDVNDIVEEIRAHILDKTSGEDAHDAVSSTLAALGTPEELASRYRTDELLKRAQVTRSPFVILRSLLRWATLSFVGLIVFFVSVVGYCIGGMLVMIALF